jgi:hypothetical protein
MNFIVYPDSPDSTLVAFVARQLFFGMWLTWRAGGPIPAGLSSELVHKSGIFCNAAVVKEPDTYFSCPQAYRILERSKRRIGRLN